MCDPPKQWPGIPSRWSDSCDRPMIECGTSIPVVGSGHRVAAVVGNSRVGRPRRRCPTTSVRPRVEELTRVGRAAGLAMFRMQRWPPVVDNLEWAASPYTEVRSTEPRWRRNEVRNAGRCYIVIGRTVTRSESGVVAPPSGLLYYSRRHPICRAG
jgi:hypothetical protein